MEGVGGGGAFVGGRGGVGSKDLVLGRRWGLVFGSIVGDGMSQWIGRDNGVNSRCQGLECGVQFASEITNGLSVGIELAPNWAESAIGCVLKSPHLTHDDIQVSNLGDLG